MLCGMSSAAHVCAALPLTCDLLPPVAWCCLHCHHQWLHALLLLQDEALLQDAALVCARYKAGDTLIAGIQGAVSQLEQRYSFPPVGDGRGSSQGAATLSPAYVQALTAVVLLWRCCLHRPRPAVSVFCIVLLPSSPFAPLEAVCDMLRAHPTVHPNPVAPRLLWVAVWQHCFMVH